LPSYSYINAIFYEFKINNSIFRLILPSSLHSAILNTYTPGLKEKYLIMCGGGGDFAITYKILLLVACPRFLASNSEYTHFSRVIDNWLNSWFPRTKRISNIRPSQVPAKSIV